MAFFLNAPFKHETVEAAPQAASARDRRESLSEAYGARRFRAVKRAGEKPLRGLRLRRSAAAPEIARCL